jgi:broad specificity phosphatase PhoE
MLNVLIVRHGQSEWNAVGRWQGHADPPLSELGISQARGAGRSVGAFDAVIASDLDRAASTARIMADALGIGPVVTDDRLRERDVGAWQALTRTQIEAQYPGQLENGHRPPGWEADESVVARAIAALERIADDVGTGNVLVVAHGGIIYSLERHLGAEFAPILNLHGRWFRFHRDRGLVDLGDRVALVPDSADTVSGI